MFLHEYAPTKLLDQDVNYYGFLESKEYSDWMKSIEGQMLTMDLYDSPYFGLQGSGAYRELDRVYEAYKSNLPIDITQPDPNVKRVTSTTSTINPLLILAAAAAAFFIGS